LDITSGILESFLAELYEFYGFMQLYKINPNDNLKVEVRSKFEELIFKSYGYSELEQRLALPGKIEIVCFNFWIVPISLFTKMSLKLQLANQSSNERSAMEQDPSWESLHGKMYYRSRILAENLVLTSFNICKIFIQILLPCQGWLR
jgi:hypothetical protein